MTQMRPAPALPAALAVALDRLAEGMSRKDAARRSTAISESYRGGGNSRTIRDADDARAYAFARMPATYAAVAACVAAVSELSSGFAPATLLDVGAGPGTATWAAAQVFASLTDFKLLDVNPALSALARDFAQHDPRLSHLHTEHGDVRQTLPRSASADLVIASYLIGELSPLERTVLTEQLWAKTNDTLLIVEPGTPAGYARIIGARTQLIGSGAHVVAPCPHHAPCPLIAPDWCHFTQRLPRSRAHIRIKDAELSFEDEKFSYVAVSRHARPRPRARVLAPPASSKVAITAKLCCHDGEVRPGIVLRRDRQPYAAARRWRWGEAIFED